MGTVLGILGICLVIVFGLGVALVVVGASLSRRPMGDVPFEVDP